MIKLWVAFRWDDYITKPFSLRELEARIGYQTVKREEGIKQKTDTVSWMKC